MSNGDDASTWEDKKRFLCELTIGLMGLTFFLTYYWVDSTFLDFAFGFVFLAAQVAVWKFLLKDVHPVWFENLILQLKTNMLITAVAVITWTEWHYAIWRQHYQSCIGSLGMQSVTLMFILADTTEVSFFFRVIVPTVLIFASLFTIYWNIFVNEEYELFKFKGHSVGLNRIQNVAWNQILIVALLGFKDILRDQARTHFYIIERNKVKGDKYKNRGWKLSWTDFFFMLTSFDYVVMNILEYHFILQVIPAVLFFGISIEFFKQVEAKPAYFLKYRSMILIGSSCVVLVSEILRLVLENDASGLSGLLIAQESLGNIFLVFCVMMVILSDFHVDVTKSFRLFTPLFLMVAVGWRIYGCSFVYEDHKLIDLMGKEFGVNELSRMAYCQIFLLLFAFLMSMATDRNLSKFFLLPERVTIGELEKSEQEQSCVDIEL